jgi:hypothetical protein
MSGLEHKGYSIDDVTKALAATAIAAYVLGYLVLSYYLSSFGFNPASPFRPRILATGICTLAFFVVPILMGIAVSSIPSRSLSTSVATLLRVLCLPVMCGALAFWLAQSILISIVRIGTLRPTYISITVFITLFIAVIFALCISIRWVWNNYDRHPGLSAIVLLLVSTLFCYPEFEGMVPAYERRLFIWFLSISVVTCIWAGIDGDVPELQRHRLAREEAKKHKISILEIITELTHEGPEIIESNTSGILIGTQKDDLLRKARELEKRLDLDISELESTTAIFRLDRLIYTFGSLTAFAYILFSVTAYSKWIFPSIPLKVGGGEVVSATIYQSRPDHTLNVVHGGVLDESDDGFYILLNGHDKGLFIPKDRIEGIYFSDDSTGIEKVLQ